MLQCDEKRTFIAKPTIQRFTSRSGLPQWLLLYPLDFAKMTMIISHLQIRARSRKVLCVGEYFPNLVVVADPFTATPGGSLAGH